MFTPLILDITFALKRNPIPYLIALATSANVGSVATIVGNPQNMIIGTISKIPFVDFAIKLTPVALIGLSIIWVVITSVYRKEFTNEKLLTPVEEDFRIFRPLLIKSTIVLVLMLAAFNLGFPIALSALAGASILLITRRIKPERVFTEIDWSLLVFFSCLFIITHTINIYFYSAISRLENYSFTGDLISDFSIVSAILSNIISNVPAVLILSPAVFKIQDNQTIWLALAMSSTFAGNLTLIGSVANLIIAESSKRRGIKLEFVEYLKVGLPVTILTLIIGIVWLISLK
jgi:Na+/H+ antiporter NhaD/arsenite permease-like protein